MNYDYYITKLNDNCCNIGKDGFSQWTIDDLYENNIRGYRYWWGKTFQLCDKCNATLLEINNEMCEYNRMTKMIKYLFH